MFISNLNYETEKLHYVARKFEVSCLRKKQYLRKKKPDVFDRCWGVRVGAPGPKKGQERLWLCSLYHTCTKSVMSQTSQHDLQQTAAQNSTERPHCFIPRQQ